MIGDLEEGYSAVSNLSYNQAVDSILSLSTPIVTTNNTKRTTFEESLASNSDNSGSVLPDSTTSSSDYPTFGLSITGGESGYEKKSDHHHDDKNQKEAKQRLTKFQDMAKKIKTAYRKNLINTNATVLFENKVKDENCYFGRDEYFNSVIVKSDYNLNGKIKNVKIVKANQNTLFGEIETNLNKNNYAA